MNEIVCSKEITVNEIKEQIALNYNIKIAKIEKNEDSTDGNVYSIETRDCKYITKIYSELKHTFSMINLHNELNKFEISVPKIIKTKKNKQFVKFDNKYIVIYSYITGEQIKNKLVNGKLDDKIIDRIADTLRNMHNKTEKNYNEFNLPECPFNNRSLRQSILHFDLTKDNVFINSNNTVSLIDLDDSKYGAAVCDVAITISLLFFSKSRGADYKDATRFINSYYKNDEVLRNEELPYLKRFGIDWINYLFNTNSFDTSMLNSFESKKVMIEKFEID